MPRTVATYSGAGDLLTGDLRLPSALSPERFVEDAADEIDSKVGKLYYLPLDFSASSDIPDYVALTLKRINNHLASGRLILAAAAAGQDTTLHAYGLSLVRDALRELDQLLAEGIPGAEERPGDAEPGVSIKQQDEVSAVSSYYDTFGLGGLEDVWRPN